MPTQIQYLLSECAESAPSPLLLRLRDAHEQQRTHIAYAASPVAPRLVVGCDGDSDVDNDDDDTAVSANARRRRDTSDAALALSVVVDVALTARLVDDLTVSGIAKNFFFVSISSFEFSCSCAL